LLGFIEDVGFVRRAVGIEASIINNVEMLTGITGAAIIFTAYYQLLKQ
jgi:hypothetical protein